MKKFSAIILTAVLLCSGCESNSVSGGTDTETENASVSVKTEEASIKDEADSSAESTQTTAQTTTSAAQETAETVQPSTGESVFLPGAYIFSYDGVTSGYMVVNDDGASGCTILYEDKAVTEFTVELGTNQFIFNYEDTTEIYDVVAGDASVFSVMLDGDSGVYDFTWMFDGTTDEVLDLFYSNAELSDYAINYYEGIYGNTPPEAYATSNADGTVHIQLADGIDTLASYTIDRHNGSGTDNKTGEDISIVPAI